MSIKVKHVIEHEDGSADIQFDVVDGVQMKLLIEEGMNFLLLKAAFGLTTSDIVVWAEEQQKL